MVEDARRQGSCIVTKEMGGGKAEGAVSEPLHWTAALCTLPCLAPHPLSPASLPLNPRTCQSCPTTSCPRGTCTAPCVLLQPFQHLLPPFAPLSPAQPQGLSILSRRQLPPRYVYCFLRVLRHVALGAAREGETLCAATAAAVEDVRQQVSAAEAFAQGSQQLSAAEAASQGRQQGMARGTFSQAGQQAAVSPQRAPSDRPGQAGPNDGAADADARTTAAASAAAGTAAASASAFTAAADTAGAAATTAVGADGGAINAASVAAGGSDGAEARAFFTDRLRSKEGEAGVSGVDLKPDSNTGSNTGGNTSSNTGGNTGDGAADSGFTLSGVQRAEAEERLRRVHAAAVLAAAAADAAMPLLSAPVLRVSASLESFLADGQEEGRLSKGYEQVHMLESSGSVGAMSVCWIHRHSLQTMHTRSDASPTHVSACFIRQHTRASAGLLPGHMPARKKHV